MPRQKSQHVDSPKAVGERLREAREAAGLSQRQLAFSGCSPAYISRIEAGDRIPSLQLLRELGRRLNVSEDYLATGVDPARQSGKLMDADLARRFDETERAAALYQEILDTTLDAGERAAALEGLGHIELRTGHPRPAVALFEQALAVSGQRDFERPALAESLGRAYAALGEFAPAMAIFERCLEHAESKRDTLGVVRFAALLSYALTDSGNLTRAEQVVTRALAAEDETLDPLARARLLWSQAKLRGESGDAEASAGYAYKALALIELTEDTDLLGLAHRIVAYAELDRGEPEAALRHLEEGWPLLERGGSPLERAHYQIDKARAYVRLGRAEEAAALALQATGKLGDALPEDAGRAYALVADVYVELGRPERAQELYELAAEYLKQNNPNRYLAEVWGKLASLHEAEGRLDRAYEYMKLALGMQQQVAGR
ncbi:MAG TPA: helix-turn-helix domain-containing protein, partial [Gaiellaceae bacterium]|nr:helix-turn-helix domain-containing protein [Gaiellaceae bacterium]